MSELDADGIPVAVTCRVLKLARQPYYRWLANPVTDAEFIEAYRANALFDAHGDDPEFGYRFLADEAADAGEAMAERTAWRICSTNGWFSRFGKKPKRGKGKKAGPPVHDDLVQRDFSASAANQLWLADISEHHTLEGKLYVCAVKDVFSDRIVGYSIDSRMKSRIAVNALNNAVARRGDVAGYVLHTDRGQPVPKPDARPYPSPRFHGRIDGPCRCSQRQLHHGEPLQPPTEERPEPSGLGDSRGAAHRHRHLDRADPPPSQAAGIPRLIDPIEFEAIMTTLATQAA